MPRQQRLAKWGNSLAVRIPREAAERAGFQAGDNVALSAAAGKLVLTRQAPQLRIQDFVKKMKPQNRHDALDWGSPRGREFW
jgi:antitoxin MazE